MILISKSTEETKLIGHDIARAILNLEKKLMGWALGNLF